MTVRHHNRRSFPHFCSARRSALGSRFGLLEQGSELAMDVESLEARELMAGDVSVQVANSGDLKITGDNADNQIRIFSNVQGNITISPENGTTINGLNQAQVFFANGDDTTDRNVKINMKGGNDRVAIRGVVVEGNVTANMGQGDDSFMLSRTGVRNNVTLKGGAGQGEDMIQVLHSNIDGRLRITTGGGNDIVATAGTLTTEVYGKSSVGTGSGNDSLFLAGTFHNSLNVNMSSGSDILAMHEFRGWAPTRINMSTGDDAVYVHSLATANTISYAGGPGTDGLAIHPATGAIGPASAFESTTILVAVDGVVDAAAVGVISIYVNTYGGLATDYI